MGHNNLNPQIIVLKKNKRGRILVLLVKRSDTLVWTLPGGRRESDESIQATAIREVKEETGFDVDIVKNLGIYTLPKLKVLGRVFIFIGRVVGGYAQISDETVKVKWFNANHLPYTLLPFHRQRIKDAILGKKNVQIRQNYTRGAIILHYIITPWILLKIIKFFKMISTRAKKE